MSAAARSNSGAETFPARVVATHGRTCVLLDAAGAEWRATRRGRRGDLVVGDRVSATVTAPQQAVVESIEPRASLLYRADAFRTKEFAANVDQMLLVFASRPTFNEWFLWKALLAASAAGIAAVVVRNKTDLTEGAAAADMAIARLTALGVPTLALSAKADPRGALAALEPLTASRATLLVGQSGMGKSTLLNLLVPEAQQRTREYSERLDLGKQTTTAARWFPRGTGAIVDTPGFQEFGLAHLDAEARQRGFPEFAALLGTCRFLDCRHLVEPGCAVRAAVDAGTVTAERYAFYRALEEAAR